MTDRFRQSPLPVQTRTSPLGCILAEPVAVLLVLAVRLFQLDKAHGRRNLSQAI